MEKWDIERMPIYVDALELVRLSEAEAARVAGRRPDIADNIRRASTSVLFNTREALQEYSPKEKARLFRLVQREAGECCAGFDAMRVLGHAVPATETARALATRIIGEATGLGQAALNRKP